MGQFDLMRFVGFGPGIDVHRAKLASHEGFAAEANTLLLKNDSTMGN
jgi:hypothetical protein